MELRKETLRGEKKMTTVSEIMEKMIVYSEGNVHDINHFMKVYAFAKLIGEGEKLRSQEQLTLEIAAIIHDIACPLCREKYGNTNGKCQEVEGIPLARKFLQDTDLPKEIVERVVYLVGHHHSVENISGLDYQILIEADYLVNAHESDYSRHHIRNTMKTIFKTKTGSALLKAIYLV